ncbi:TSC22 domain family protein 2 isoform X2 [Fundulus heteroclitus]|uniref:TSC22 domain family protein 2 isoform X2 n=1 Tax=Fundulus heteroclitus TaxID=8078 RepID=UPI00165B0EAC|nr:TSC22 domain family protein 2 isoform X2 [Fundulus heteroclitus]
MSGKTTGKKKSCFRITSVTLAGGLIGDGGSGDQRLDDPEEARTELRSPVAFDRFDAGGCDRAPAEETSNSVGENQEGQPPMASPVNGGFAIKPTPSGRNTPHSVEGSVPFVPSSSMGSSAAAAALTSMIQAASSSSTSCSSSSSRFRVIKLDHSNGEPFRRGRWTCTEFYEKESDSGAHRTVDSFKSSPSVDHSGDRDSGLGATYNFAVSGGAFPAPARDNCTESPAGHHTHSQASEPPQQGHGLSPQAEGGASAFQSTVYAAAASPQQAARAQGNASPPAGPQTFAPDGLNGDAGSRSGFVSGSAQQQQPSGGAGGAPAPSAAPVSVHGDGQNVPATVPSTTGVPPGAASQAGGLIQLQGGVVSSTEPLFHRGAVAVPAKDGVRSPIGEGFRLSSPTVNSFFGIQITMNEDGDGASGANVVAIDNKIEQAMDLVKSHLMYAVREEVEVLKEQIKELYERNSVLERENAVLKSLASTEQLSQLPGQLGCLSPPLQLQLHQPPFIKNGAHSLVHHEGSQGVSYQPNITSA